MSKHLALSDRAIIEKYLAQDMIHTAKKNKSGMSKDIIKDLTDKYVGKIVPKKERL